MNSWPGVAEPNAYAMPRRPVSYLQQMPLSSALPAPPLPQARVPSTFTPSLPANISDGKY